MDATMFRMLLASISHFVITGARAQDLKLPKFAPEDSWIYHEAIQKGDKTEANDREMSVVRSDDQDLLVSIKTVGSTRPPVEVMFKPDWANFRGVNGVETVVNRPLAFPLALGKSWGVNYVENNPNPRFVRELIDITYKVVGWEDLTTPAGAFKALKIDGKGNWVTDSAAQSPNQLCLGEKWRCAGSVVPECRPRSTTRDGPYLSRRLVCSGRQALGKIKVRSFEFDRAGHQQRRG